MNEVFHPYLQKFVLVFFNDILICNRIQTKHLVHMRRVFTKLHTHQLFLKQSKFLLSLLQVVYLGHVVSAKGVEVNQSKITTIMEWPQPQTVRTLHEFLGLGSEVYTKL